MVDFLLDGGNVVAEAQSGTVTGSYLRGVNLICREAGVATEYYLFNAHGDVVTTTDPNGTVSQSYDYDAFGNEKNPDPDDANPFRYCGEYLESETGSYYLRARYYDPAIGRFTQEDTHWNTANMIYGDNPQKINQREDKLGLKTYTHVPEITAIMQSGNLYVYGINNPITFTDPTGNVITPANLIGAVIGAGGGALLGTLVADYYGLSGWKRSLTIAGFTAGGAALGWFAGPLVEKLAVQIATRLGLISTASGLYLSEISQAVGNVINNRINHIMYAGHAWDLVGETHWSGISKVITYVLINGTAGTYKAGNTIYSAYYNGKLVQVVIRIVDGVVTIVDAWVRTK